MGATRERPECPFCGSRNVLPYEDDPAEPEQSSFVIVLLSALSLILVYFIFLVFSYINYPLMIMITVGVLAWIMGRREKKRRPAPPAVDRPFVCLDCNSHFHKNSGTV